jgi:hypothetical protein
MHVLMVVSLHLGGGGVPAVVAMAGGSKLVHQSATKPRSIFPIAVIGS